MNRWVKGLFYKGRWKSCLSPRHTGHSHFPWLSSHFSDSANLPRPSRTHVYCAPSMDTSPVRSSPYSCLVNESIFMSCSVGVGTDGKVNELQEDLQSDEAILLEKCVWTSFSIILRKVKDRREWRLDDVKKEMPDGELPLPGVGIRLL